MKLEKLYLENFRGFKNRTYVNFDNITTLIGKNDIGKSTILDAMDLFFNDKDSTVKLESNDYNIKSLNKSIIIGGIFSDLPESLIIDSQHPTTLADEYLLNVDGLLEVQKVYESGKVKEVKIIANHPVNEELTDIFELKINELRQKAEKFSIGQSQ